MQIKWVNFPKKENGKFGSIVMADGTKYMVPVRRMNLFRQGMDCEPEWDGKKWGDDEVMVIKDGWSPDNNTVGAIIPQNGVQSGHPSPMQSPAPPRTNGNGGSTYTPKDEDLITRLAILKSLIESGALLQGMGMDDLVALAWETAPKMKVWKQ